MIVKNKIKSDVVTDSVKITEFPLAATLVLLGYELKSIEIVANEPQKFEFFFEKDEAIGRIAIGYLNGNLLVEPKKFLEVRKEINSKIKNLK
jgi:hypothetical protein